MELEFYSDKREGPRLTPTYKTGIAIPEMKKRIAKSRLWQAICTVTGGILAMFIIISITGIIVPQKTLVIDEPYFQNDRSKPVCVTFLRDPEKVWRDGSDYSRIGAQYNGMIYNNMRATTITDWSFTIAVPQDCSVDNAPWNGTFSLSQSSLRVKKPGEGDKENIHGSDFYKVTPLKTLGFGCIMYTPGRFVPSQSRLIFTYEGLLKPLSYIGFDILFVLVARDCRSG